MTSCPNPTGILSPRLQHSGLQQINQTRPEGKHYNNNYEPTVALRRKQVILSSYVLILTNKYRCSNAACPLQMVKVWLEVR